MIRRITVGLNIKLTANENTAVYLNMCKYLPSGVETMDTGHSAVCTEGKRPSSGLYTEMGSAL